MIRETALGLTTRTFVHGPGIDEVLADADAVGRWAFHHVDGLGSTVRTTKRDGSLWRRTRYDGFGNIIGGQTTGVSYTGRDWDAETGLYYYRARYYDPKIGRFLSEDPLRFANGNSLYGYVLNNPVNLLDPFGLYDCPIPFCNGRIEAALRDKAKLYCQSLSKDASRELREELTEAEFNEVKNDATSSVRGADILEAVATRLLNDPSVPKAVKEEILRFLANKDKLREKAKLCDQMRSQGNKDPRPPCP